MSKSLTDPWWVKKGLSKPPTLREADSWAKHKKEKEEMNMNNFKFVGDGVDAVCEDLVGHQNWAWAQEHTIEDLQNDPEYSGGEIDTVIIIYKNPITE